MITPTVIAVLSIQRVGSKDSEELLLLLCETGEKNLDLLKAADIATPHIAGYSQEGKRTATSAVLKAVAGHFGIDALMKKAEEFDSKTVIKTYSPGGYDITADDRALRSHPELFEKIRNNYNYR